MMIVLNVSKFLIGGGGVLLFFYRNNLFAQFARDGTRNADAIHKVLVNNHGSFSYITIEQSDYLRELVIISFGLIGLMIVVDILQRRFLK